MSLHTAPLLPPFRLAGLRRLLPFLALLCLCDLGHAANAKTLTVPGQYPTIQKAINAAAGGDTVLIANGTYSGPGDVDLDFLGKSLTVTSQNGAARTVIDCGGFSSSDGSGDHRGFTLHSGETSAVISGLTIRHGYESGNGSSDGNGGGIEVLGATVTVQNCVLQHDTAPNGSGGGLANGGTATLTNDTLTGDTAVLGGGLYSGGTATLTNCALTGDTAEYGGGLLNDTSGTVRLTDCALTGDTAPFGGGLDNNSGMATLINCTLTGDTAQLYGGGLSNIGTLTLTNDTLTGDTAQHGGGLYNGSGGTATLTNCTLSGNTAQYGGGLANDRSSTVGLTNDILTGDTAQYGGELINFSGGTASATHCDIAGEVLGGVTDGGGNINADPRFVAPPTDVHLRSGSPCLGAGTASGAPATDKDGTVRPDPPSIGAYELGRTLTVASDGSGQYATIQAAINAANPGNTVLVADGTYTGPGNVDLDFLGKNITVTSVNGSAKTIIDCGGFSSSDGSGDHRGFYIHSGETSAVISGLTVKNGYESGNGSSDAQGGGIEVLGASVTVQNCVLQNDTAGFAGGGLFTNGTVGLTNDTLSGDTAQYGGGLYNDQDGTVTLTNDALTGDTVQGNTCGGGGLYNSGTVTLTGCALTGDSAQGFGGFTGDSAQDGGGLFNNDTATLTDCTLTGDTAQYGGGLFTNGTVGLTNCALTGDTAQEGGGLFINSGGTAGLTNDTLTDNSAQQYGGGVYNDGGMATLTNDILYGDTAQSGGGELSNVPGGTASAMNCDIAGGLPSGTTDNGGNISRDPMFVSPPTDLHLKPGSFCLGAGTPNGAPTTTLDGQPRPNPPSIGAFEAEPQTVNSAYHVYAVNASGPAGQTVLLSAALLKPGGMGLSGATLTFSVDGMAVGSAVTGRNGIAGFHYTLPSTLSLGGHTITASFAGDGTDPASSGTATLTVTKAHTALTVASVSGVAGQTVTLTATLRSGKAGVPGETLTFSVGGSVVGSATTNSAGVAGLSYTIPAGSSAGGQAITVTFAGDGTYAAGTGQGTLTVKSATALSVSGVSGSRGATVTLSATLTSGGVGVAGKTVMFTVDGKAVGTAVTGSTGTASLSYVIPSSDRLGAHSVGASFAGDRLDTPSNNKGTLTIK